MPMSWYTAIKMKCLSYTTFKSKVREDNENHKEIIYNG